MPALMSSGPRGGAHSAPRDLQRPPAAFCKTVTTQKPPQDFCTSQGGCDRPCHPNGRPLSPLHPGLCVTASLLRTLHVTRTCGHMQDNGTPRLGVGRAGLLENTPAGEAATPSPPCAPTSWPRLCCKTADWNTPRS